GVRRDVTMLGLAAAGLVVVSASAAAAGAPLDGVPAEPRVHEVKAGDTLVKLAERYGVSVMAIVAENRLASARVVLRIGQRLDIKAEPGTPVKAAAPGVVVMSGVEPRYGRVVKIAHDGGFLTVYAHNDANLVEAGDRVAAGETIATVGRTGRATTDHLHFEIRRQGRTYNPLYLLPLPPRIARVEETDDNPSDE